MTVATILDFPGVTQAMYDAMGAALAGGEPPTGILYHACGPIDGGWRIADIWESQSAFDRFVDERLIPAMRSVGGPEPSRREVVETYHAGPVISE
jgi:hypothetical protein